MNSHREPDGSLTYGAADEIAAHVDWATDLAAMSGHNVEHATYDAGENYWVCDYCHHERALIDGKTVCGRYDGMCDTMEWIAAHGEPEPTPELRITLDANEIQRVIDDCERVGDDHSAELLRDVIRAIRTQSPSDARKRAKDARKPWFVLDDTTAGIDALRSDEV